ncbi:unnamed protein product [Caenorhabditis nigoni]
MSQIDLKSAKADSITHFINEELLGCLFEPTDSRPVLRRLQRLLERPKEDRMASAQEIGGLKKVEKKVAADKMKYAEHLRRLTVCVRYTKYALTTHLILLLFIAFNLDTLICEALESAGECYQGILWGLRLCFSGPAFYLGVRQLRLDPEEYTKREEKTTPKEKDGKDWEDTMELSELTRRQMAVLEVMYVDVERSKQKVDMGARWYHLTDLVLNLLLMIYLTIRLICSTKSFMTTFGFFDSTNIAFFIYLLYDGYQVLEVSMNTLCVSTQLAYGHWLNGVLSISF